MQNVFFKLSEWLTTTDAETIAELERECRAYDGATLKLELDYKLGCAATADAANAFRQSNEFFCFADRQLIGYLGLCGFGGAALEANGMVRPQYRRKGVFGRLLELAVADVRRRGASLLLLTDHESAAGIQFIERSGGAYRYSEYEMSRPSAMRIEPAPSSTLRLRRATNDDVREVARQNAIYFGAEQEAAEVLLPEREAERGLVIYIAEQDGQAVGKVHLQQTDAIGWIYGLGVLPELRGRGLGRAILQQAMTLLPPSTTEARLQVAAENANALNLYCSCGFAPLSTMDYYEISL